MTTSVTPDIGARKARVAGASPPMAAAASPDFEADSIVVIYWTSIAVRKGFLSNAALHHCRKPAAQAAFPMCNGANTALRRLRRLAIGAVRPITQHQQIPEPTTLS
ncbi:hypothetical protein [Bosea sp. WAO]|uniref:hypothetical protein n=1 Tax=Bosea sp. WAO TaxID=406341 RepID=UPI00161631D5|nr:hypothetical protein [Bosea sp. WAO]